MDWLGTALSLFDHVVEYLTLKEKNKYKDKKIKLEMKYYEEKNKTPCDHAVLDNLEHELFVLCRTVGAEVARQASSSEA
jgi:hypothetical protein